MHSGWTTPTRHIPGHTPVQWIMQHRRPQHILSLIIFRQAAIRQAAIRHLFRQPVIQCPAIPNLFRQPVIQCQPAIRHLCQAAIRQEVMPVEVMGHHTQLPHTQRIHTQLRHRHTQERHTQLRLITERRRPVPRQGESRLHCILVKLACKC